MDIYENEMKQIRLPKTYHFFTMPKNVLSCDLEIHIRKDLRYKISGIGHDFISLTSECPQNYVYNTEIIWCKLD